MAPRRKFWAHDVDWHRSLEVVELGEEFGAAGPHVLGVIYSMAAEQDDDTGTAATGYAAVAREAFVTRAEAKAILERAVELGCIDVVPTCERTFLVSVVGWSVDQRALKEQRRRSLSPVLRRAVIARDGLVCGICCEDVAPDDVHIDHVVPWARGGRNELSNLQVAHSTCNLQKGAY